VKLVDLTSATWMDVGRLAEMMNETERARLAYESALKLHHDSIPARKALGILYKDKYKNMDKVQIDVVCADKKAVEFFISCIQADPQAGDLQAMLGIFPCDTADSGHCYLMMGNLPDAYICYQRALSVPATVIVSTEMSDMV
jgi:general transcriptional corepressor CYC8